MSAQAAKFLGPEGGLPLPVRHPGHALRPVEQEDSSRFHLRIRTYASGELAFGKSRSEVKAELVAAGWPEKLIEQLVPSRREEPLVAFVTGHVALGTSPYKLERCLVAQGVERSLIESLMEIARSSFRCRQQLRAWLAAATGTLVVATLGTLWLGRTTCWRRGLLFAVMGGAALGLLVALGGLARLLLAPRP